MVDYTSHVLVPDLVTCSFQMSNRIDRFIIKRFLFYDLVLTIKSKHGEDWS